jgi:hypothetical protein
MYVDPGADVTISNCLFAANHVDASSGLDGVDGTTSGDGRTGGSGTSGTPGFNGLGGAILNLGTLAIFNSSFVSNSALGGAGGNGGNGSDGSNNAGSGGDGASGGQGRGGAIFNGGTLSLTNCTISSNSVAGGDGGSGGTAGANGFDGRPGSGMAGGNAFGAGIYSTQTLAVAACTLANNTARGGDSAAAGWASGSTSGADGSPGGAAAGGGVYGSVAFGLTNCTFFANQTAGGAGGDGGSSTKNEGQGGVGGSASGGAVYGTAGNFSAVTCTIASCAALGGTNGADGSGTILTNGVGTNTSSGLSGPSNGGGITRVGPATTTTFFITGTLLFSNAPGNNLSGSFTDGGFNLVSPDASSGLLTDLTDIKTNNPGLGPLANNGGPTNPTGGCLTMALTTTNSPAVGQIPTNDAPGFDQRGVQRPQPPGGRCDIGAFEFVYQPFIVTQPQNQTNASGSNVTFSVLAFPSSSQFQWFFNTNLNSFTDTALIAAGSTPITNGTSSVLSFTANIANAGNYFVVVSNQFGSATSTPPALLFVGPVTSPPTLTSSNNSVQPGDNVTIISTAQGSPPLFGQWFFNQTNIGPALMSNLPSANFQLPLPNAQVTNMGAYSLVVSNFAGSVTSAVFNLVVDGPPVITNQPVNQTTLIGNPATFTVGAIGPPTSQYQWYFNQSNLITGARAASFTLANAQLTNAGAYSVIVSNNFGSATSTPALLSVGTFGPGGSNSAPANLAAVDVAVAGNYAYLVLSNSAGPNGLLQVINVSSPTNPVPVGSNSLPTPGSVFVSGPFAFVACGSNGLQIVDVSSPTNPVVVSSLTTDPASVNGVWVNGSSAYVADGIFGLNLVDVSNPRTPVWVTNAPLGDPAVAVQVAANLAYMAVLNNGLQIIDVSNPTNLVVKGQGTNAFVGASAVGVQVVGSSAYVVAADTGIEIMNVSNPTNPSTAGVYTNALTKGLAVSGGYAFIASGPNGLIAANISNPTNTFFGGSSAIPDSANAVAVSGRNVYVAAGIAGLVVLDAGSALDSAPQILVQPQNLSVGVGSNAVFSVTVNGSTPLSFLWLQGGVPLTNNDPRFLGTTSSTLVVSNTQMSDSTNFSVIVSNAVGAITSSVAQLTVTGCVFTLTPPAITNLATSFSGSFDVASSNGCDWTASTTNTWIHLTGTTSGDGNGTIPFLVDTNADTNSRTGFIFVSGTNFTFMQFGIGVTNSSNSFVRGTYTGLFYDKAAPDQQSSGYFKLVITPAGRLSGFFQIGTTRYPASGQLDVTGSFSDTLVHNRSSILVTFQIDPFDSDRMFGTVSGNLSDIPWVVPLMGDRAVFSAKNPAPQQGRYTMIIPGDPTSTNNPGGDSWATVTVSKAGAIHLSGSLSDKTSISQSATISKDALWPLYIPLYGGKGSLLSWISFVSTGTNDLSGLLDWIKPAMKTKFYPGGFSIQTNAWGSRYVRPPRNTPILDITNGEIDLLGGDLTDPVQITNLTLGPNNRVTGDSQTTLNFATPTGVFHGHTRNSVPSSISYTGVGLTSSNIASGYFLGTSQSGRVQFHQ